MTPEEAITQLDDLAEHGPHGDCETMHVEADRILLALAGPEVQAALRTGHRYLRLVGVCLT